MLKITIGVVAFIIAFMLKDFARPFSMFAIFSIMVFLWHCINIEDKITKELTSQEINVVSGSFGPAGAGIGAFIGGADYLGNSVISGNFTWSGFATSVAVGATSEVVGGPIGSAAAKYLVPRIGFLGGATVGIADKK
ncbi:hypothetical protein [Rodentibacter haemolyticus]|uniref:ABC transporter permease n=1 Tax=Rodentibacter haemolyticus TaxID=2778911 RepID=A0ABX6UWQ5_9PAST|nr:hypothetical protein [Rodentibacter haemolyticus]QPB41621.1 hypothetical protein IHV77_06635 [Rodentibacter haemolyticus]